ncbi:MAG: hypothetical protein L0219_15215 [Phycisphaerales bacterium]|nr:hypothetical protein [Phycisphaerales bacterium]
MDFVTVYHELDTYVYKVHIKHWKPSSRTGIWDHYVPNPDGSARIITSDNEVMIAAGEWPRSEGRPTIERIQLGANFRGWFALDWEWIGTPIIYVSAVLIAVAWRFRGIVKRVSKQTIVASKRLSDRFDATIETMNSGSRR